jgi:hypothetical protein
MLLKRVGSQPSTRGPAERFPGTVRIDPLHTAPEPARVACVSVTFELGARTNWHTHPLGQTLIVVFGCGWTQCEGEPIVEIHAGDVVWSPQSPALARRVSKHVDDAHRHPGGFERRDDWMAGHGRAICCRTRQA